MEDCFLLVLGIDTTEKFVNFSLTKDNEILSSAINLDIKTENLISFLDKVYKENNEDVKKTNLIGVITGPGGYTSSRSGIVLAKTIAQLLNINVIGFDKIELIIKSYNSNSNSIISPIIDVKRDELYTCIAKKLNNFQIEYFIKPCILKINEYLELINEFKHKIIIINQANKELNIKNDLVIVDNNFVLRPEYINFQSIEQFNMGLKTTYKDINTFYIREAI